MIDIKKTPIPDNQGTRVTRVATLVDAKTHPPSYSITPVNVYFYCHSK